VFGYDDLMKRDKANLNGVWLKGKSLADGDDLLEPDILPQEIADDLQTALDQFAAIASELR
jgi:type I restriction enzyme M protein